MTTVLLFNSLQLSTPLTTEKKRNKRKKLIVWEETNGGVLEDVLEDTV